MLTKSNRGSGIRCQETQHKSDKSKDLGTIRNSPGSPIRGFQDIQLKSDEIWECGMVVTHKPF